MTGVRGVGLIAEPNRSKITHSVCATEGRALALIVVFACRGISARKLPPLLLGTTHGRFSSAIV
jgi:hypothetical protein